MHFPIYLLRHGQTEWNRDRRVQGSLESQLTSLGRRQAAAQARLLAPILAATPNLDLYASPQIRARQTAEIALPGHDAEITYDARLAELNMGDWEGHLRADLEPENPILRDPHTPIFAQCMAATNGEGFDALSARLAAFL